MYGRQYAGSDHVSVYAFDAAGNVGCSGSMIVACEPLRSPAWPPLRDRQVS